MTHGERNRLRLVPGRLVSCHLLTPFPSASLSSRFRSLTHYVPLTHFTLLRAKRLERSGKELSEGARFPARSDEGTVWVTEVSEVTQLEALYL